MFVNETKRDEIQVSRDIINTYPLVPIIKGLNALIDQPNNCQDDFMERTKLNLKHIYELAVSVNVSFHGTMKLEY